ncbi:DNA-binding protein [Halomonas sp. PAR8]|uniref:DNA-binding protein n=1 Tax=Halomonas sp. PAR8 TaxID=3075515 RepID=UPI0028838FBD|nr:DNA-binding protein [Halomonas sp. PAR8]MDT0592776.1 DNA-binding protein [Halomonas sp. PAR8]
MNPSRDSVPTTSSLTYEQVVAAAENLEHRGAEPTLQRVLELLGIGSPNIVQRHLSAWRDTRSVPEPSAPRLPAALIDALERELATHANTGLAEGRRLADEARADATTLAEAGEALERRNHELAQRLEATERAGQIADERASTLLAERDSLRDKLERERQLARQAQQTLAEQRQQVALLREQLEEAQQARLTAERGTRASEEERIKAERAQAVAESQRDGALEQAREKTEQIAQLKQEMQEERARQRQEITEMRAEQKARLDAAERSRQEAQKHAQEALQRATKAEIRVEALQATQSALKSRMDAMQVQRRQHGRQAQSERA